MVLEGHGVRTRTPAGKICKPASLANASDKEASGCDLKSHLYSFSFNPNPNWSKELCEQPEILQCKHK